MIRWFERQRAFRADVTNIKLDWEEKTEEQKSIPVEDVNALIEDLETVKEEIKRDKERPTLQNSN